MNVCSATRNRRISQLLSADYDTTMRSALSVNPRAHQNKNKLHFKNKCTLTFVDELIWSASQEGPGCGGTLLKGNLYAMRYRSAPSVQFACHV
eukprot:COSAG01_NODE_50935_length_359_cov_0.592308_1_plen_92_part_10